MGRKSRIKSRQKLPPVPKKESATEILGEGRVREKSGKLAANEQKDDQAKKPSEGFSKVPGMEKRIKKGTLITGVS